MNPDEIGNYIGETLKWSTLAGIGYILSLMALAYPSYSPFQKSINSLKELESVVTEEANKLKLDPKKIRIIEERDACWINSCKEGYELSIEVGSRACTRKTVRHELYHAYRDAASLKKFEGASLLRSTLNFQYLFVAEPRAILYGTFGIKI